MGAPAGCCLLSPVSSLLNPTRRASGGRLALAAVTLSVAASAFLLAGCGSRPATHGGAPGKTAASSAPTAADADFVDIAPKAGLNFAWTHHVKGPWTNLEAFGCGCAFIDYDGDGWMDIFLVGRPRCALFHNNHDGTFTDVSAKAGIAKEGIWTGVAAGDYDNDGHEDLFVTGYRCSMLLHNNGNGTFSDRTKGSGLEEKEWGSSAAFLDADGDGRLDLLIGHYVITGGGAPWYCDGPGGVKVGCRPQAYQPEFAKLFHNNGNGTFTDISHRSGIDKAHGKALAIQLCDYDNDGKIDFYIANDGVAGDMFHNLGHGRFEDVSIPMGTAYNSDGAAQAGMGVDFADYDHDGKMDMVVTAFQNEQFSLYHNLGGAFSVTSLGEGLGLTRNFLGFGVKFFDFNNDGWPDLVFADGHVYDNVAQIDPQATFRQPLLLFRNNHGHFSRVENAGPGFNTPIVGRGLAVGDIENDGSQDLLVVDYDGHPLLLHNFHTPRNHWLGVKLTGTKSNRDGYGARVTVEWPGGRLFGDCSAAGSYLSSMDPRLHFGLGSAGKVADVRVRWPDGSEEVYQNPPIDRYVTLVEGQSRPSAQRR